MALCPDHHAIVIGINHYPKHRSLDGPINDAKKFHEWLIDKDNGGGVPDNQAHLIISKDDKMNPTPIKNEIDKTLEDIVILMKSVPQKPGCRFYLFFAGHGLGLEQDDTGICMADWFPLLLKGSLSSRNYINTIFDSGMFSEVFCFLDCCRSFLIGATGQDPTVGFALPGSGGRKFLGYATEFKEAAYEAANPDENIPDNLKRGHFTRALLAGLNGGAKDDRGNISVALLKSYIEVQTREIAKENGQRQKAIVLTDMANDVGVSEAPNIFEDVLCQITISTSRKGNILLQNAQTFAPIPADLKAGTTFSISLQPGFYVLLDLSDAASIKRFWIRPGEEVSNVSF